MRFIIIVLLLWTTPAHAQTVYLNYGQWVQMPISFREMYVAGAFDAISIVAIPEHATFAGHYNTCIARIGLSTGQLAENMKAFGETQPGLQNKPAPGVLMRYLISLCGTPTAQ